MIFDKRIDLLLMLILVVLLPLGCGEKTQAPPLSLSGTITLGAAVEDNTGPIFVTVSSSNDLDLVQSRPADTLITMISIDESNYTFSIDLSETGLEAGDSISIIAFIDNDYEEGLPNVTEGDYVGFYMDSNTMAPSYVLESGDNEGIDIEVTREVFSLDKEISGTIFGDCQGDILVFAYTGEINSFDFEDLDFDKVIGYKKISKQAYAVDYKLEILPFGMDLPIENVYIFALFDYNASSLADCQYSMGYHTVHPQKLPTLITLTHDPQTDIDIEMILQLPEPSGYDISLVGNFEKPDNYDSYSEPIFIIVAKGDNPVDVFTSPLSAIKYFQKLPLGDSTFDIDLSSTDLVPKDHVMIIALWDKDYEAGFPDPTADDYVGYYQNKENFLVSVALTQGANTITPTDGWEFLLNKKIFDHNASLSFQLEDGGGVFLNPGDQVVVVAVQEDGVGIDFVINDMDYLIAMKTIQVNEANNYHMEIFPALLEEIVDDPFGINGVFVYGILDENENNRPDSGEPIGFYWRWLLFFIPKTTDISNVTNQLDRTIRFTYNTF